MIRTFSRLLFISFVFSSHFSTNLHAQTVAGEKATLIRISDAPSGVVTDMSPDGNYFVGNFGGSGGFLYNRSTDSVMRLSHIYPRRVANNATIIGDSGISYMTGNTSHDWTNAAVYKDGKVRVLPPFTGYNPNDPTEYHRNYSGWGISGDGRVMTGMGYTTVPYGGTGVYFIGLVWENETFTRFLYPAFSFTGLSNYGCRANGISADGSVIYGWGQWQNTGVRTPHIWRGDTAIFLGNNDDVGEVFSSNSDGSLLSGYLGASGAIWYKNDTGYIREDIPTYPGWNKANFTGISDNGLAIGYANEGALVWSKETGTLPLSIFLRELYGLTATGITLEHGTDISIDGKVLCGYGLVGSNYGSFIVVLGDSTVNSRPQALRVKQTRETMFVTLSWFEPIPNGRQITGYNAYRNGVKMNSTPITTLSYVDPAPAEGYHTYTVTAIYQTGESNPSDAFSIQIVPVGGCYSVKRINHEVIYNRTVAVRWGLSTDRVENGASASPTLFGGDTDQIHKAVSGESVVESKTKYVSEDMDFISKMDLLSDTRYTFFKYKDYYYSTTFNTRGIAKFDDAGHLAEVFDIPSLPAVIAFATDGTSVYVACVPNRVYKIDLENKSILDYFSVSNVTEINHFTYVASLDGGNGGFEVGGWQTSFFIKKDGELIGDGLSLSASTSGTAYYKGKIYTNEQSGTKSALIREYDLSTKLPTGRTIDYMNKVDLTDASPYGGGAGSISIAILDDSTVCLVPVYQVAGGSNCAVLLELESNPNLRGYNLFRNGVKLNSTPLQKRTYNDVVFDSGIYVYRVNVEFNNNCTSEMSDSVVAEIFPTGTCQPPSGLDAREINGETFLTFDAPSQTAKLVGFNVYRNGEQINDELWPFLYYTDKAATSGVPLTYRIECFYNNSCVASDSIEITLTGEGSCSAPIGLNLSAVASENSEKYDVTAKWSLPYFEEPYPLYYGEKAIVNAIGLADLTPLTVAVGWDSVTLKMYEGFDLGGISFFLVSRADVKPIVILDDNVVYYEPFEGMLDYPNYNTVMFDSPISLDGIKELVVGYTGSNYTEQPFGLSYGPVKAKYGDLISQTPENMSSWRYASQSGVVENNFAITALLVKQRDVTAAAPSAAKKSGGTPLLGRNINTENVTQNITVKQLKQPLYATSNTLKLTGFNIYRNGIQLNENVLTDVQFKDADVAPGTYEYVVSSLWNECDAIPCEPVYYTVEDFTANETVNNFSAIKVYPNPATEYITAEGEYVSAQIIDMAGNAVKTVSGNTRKISVKNLASGSYLLRFILANNQVYVCKLLVK
ncbi:MAG: T9SS type A sorting domain-containing protein [Bacteroidales bacterium]|jgi:hypothetical protein|nr:T9SS type A sorting domain-containing protein [Bacteroidales bacterium]